MAAVGRVFGMNIGFYGGGVVCGAGPPTGPTLVLLKW